MSDVGKEHKVDDDVNDVPISPPGPDVWAAKVKREAPERLGRGTAQETPAGRERVVDTDQDPDALPPGDRGQDAGAAEAARNIDDECGGPTPVIGP